SQAITHAGFTADGQRVVAVSGQRARVWALSPDRVSSDADFARLADLLAGARMSGASGKLVPIEGQQFRDAWREVRRSPLLSGVSPRPAPAWHWRQWEECQEGRLWSAALWHLDRLRPTEPDQKALASLREEAVFGLGDFVRVQDEF